LKHLVAARVCAAMREVRTEEGADHRRTVLGRATPGAGVAKKPIYCVKENWNTRAMH